MKEHWGTIIWRFFHVMVYNINENTFYQNKSEIINCINYIGMNLPCGACSFHYKNNNFLYHDKIFHKEGLITKIWDIHNNVNKLQNKKLFSIKILDNYKNIDFSIVREEFIKKIGHYNTIKMDVVDDYLNKINFE